jgi:tetratricopeptide (TPR) repeat protein
VATGQLIDVDPKLALAHALVARRKASRIAAVREAAGLAAYHAGEWQTAIAELRTYHRMSGKQTHLAVLADCERALGRPERAIDLYRTADRTQLDAEEVVELLIVAAGARADLGQTDAAVAMLQVRELTATPDAPWAPRLRYAYADALLKTGRREEAREWFARASEIDEDLDTDAAERVLELDGVVLEGDEDEEEDFDEVTDVTEDFDDDQDTDREATDREAADDEDVDDERDNDIDGVEEAAYEDDEDDYDVEEDEVDEEDEEDERDDEDAVYEDEEEDEEDEDDEDDDLQSHADDVANEVSEEADEDDEDDAAIVEAVKDEENEDAEPESGPRA